MLKKSIILVVLILQTVLLTKALANQILTPKSDSSFICKIHWNTAIETIINRPQFKRSRWGILIKTLKSEETLYTLDSDKYFIPASNVKLLTTAGILRQLGTQFRFHTSVYGSGSIPILTSLRLVGKGDPSLTTIQLQDIAKQLKQQGVREIKELSVDDSYFQAFPHPSWAWEDVYNYWGVAVNSLILNENKVKLTITPQQLNQPVKWEFSDTLAPVQWQVENQAITAPSGTPYSIEVNTLLAKPRLIIKGQLAIDAQSDIWYMAIPDPNRYFLESFRSILLAEDITVDNAIITNSSTSPERELAVITSDTLNVLLEKTNQESNNLFAEALVKTLSHQNGLEVVKDNLTSLGVNPDSYVLADASGLSRLNLVSPSAIAETLILMAKTQEAEVYRASLSVAGVNGTLKKTFKNTEVEGILQGKSGTLTGIYTLSGYLDVPDYQTLVFSIMINQSDQSVASQREAVKKIIFLMRQLKNC